MRNLGFFIILFCVLAPSNPAFAQAENFQPSLATAKVVKNLKVIVRQGAALSPQRLEIVTVDKNVTLMTYTPSSVMEQVRDVDVIELQGYKNPLVVTTWYTGVHSQVVVIFDPKLRAKAMLTSLYSVWTVSYAPIGDHLDIDFYEEATPRTLTTVSWLPGVKIGLEENSGLVTAGTAASSVNGVGAGNAPSKPREQK